MGERRKRKTAWDEDDAKRLSAMSEINSWTKKDHCFSHGSGHYHDVSESRTFDTQKSRDNSVWPAWESVEKHPIAPMNSCFKNAQEFSMGERRKCKSAWDEDDTKHLSGTSENNSWTKKGCCISHGSGHYHDVSESRTFDTQKSGDNSGWPAWESVEEHAIAPMNSSFKNAQEFSMGDRRKHKSAWDKDDTKHLSGASKNNSWTKKDHCFSHGSRHYHDIPESRTFDTQKSRDNSGWAAWESVEEHPIAPMNTSIKNAQDGKEFDGGKRYYKNMPPGFNGMDLRTYNDTHEYDRSHSRRYWGRGRSRSRSRSFSRGNERERRRGLSRSRSRSRSGFKEKDHSRIRIPISARLSYGWSDRSSGPEQSSRICRDFSTGSCRRGSQCRFFHPNTISRRDIDLLEDDPRESWRRMTDYNRVPKHYYRRAPGLESRSVVCDPYHEEDEHFLNKYRRSVPRRFAHHAASNDSLSGNTYLDKGNNGKPLCKFFAAGKCSNKNCRFSHDDLDDVRRVVVTGSRSHDESNWSSRSTWDNEIIISNTLMSVDDSGNVEIDDRWDWRLENENKNWGTIESTLTRESGKYSENTGFYEPIAKEDTVKKQEHLILYGSQLQDHDGVVNVDAYALDENIHPASQIQRVKETNQINSFGSDSLNPSNGFCADLNEPSTDIVDPLNVQTHTQNNQKASQSPGLLEEKVPQLLANLLTKKLSDQATDSPSAVGQNVSPVIVPVSLRRSFVSEHSQTYAEMPYFSDTSGWAPLVNASNVQPNPGAVFLDLNSMGNDREIDEHENLNLAQGTEQNGQIPLKQSSPLSVLGLGFDSSKVRQEDVAASSEVNGGNKVVGDETKCVEENKHFEIQNGHEKVEEGVTLKDENRMRLFKNNLVEFVKEILKPTWKEGRMSREDHKTVVRKVVDKVSSTIQVDHSPNTQETVDQYLACSKPKITKLVQAYVERSLKKDS